MFYTVMVRPADSEWEICYDSDGREPFISKVLSDAQLKRNELQEKYDVDAFSVEYQVFQINPV